MGEESLCDEALNNDSKRFRKISDLRDYPTP